jgi:hypothetical protein
MANKKSQKKTTQTSRPKSRKAKPKVNFGVVSKQAIETVCSVTDPFCPHADGAKWIETQGAASFGLGLRQRVSISTNSNGKGALVFAPSSDDMFANSVTVSTNTITFAALTGGSSVLDAMVTAGYVDEVRVVSAGCFWYDTLAATAEGGYVLATEYDDYSPLIGTTYNCGTFGQGNRDYSDNLRKQGAWISRPTKDSAYEFSPLTSAGTGGTNDRTCLVLTIAGPDSTNGVLHVDLFVNLEFTLKTNVIPRQIATQDKRKHSAALVQVAKEVGSTVKSFYSKGIEVVSKTVVDMAKNALVSAAKGAMAGLIGGPALGYRVGVGSMLTNYAPNVD